MNDCYQFHWYSQKVDSVLQNLLFDLLSLIVWGMHNNIVFKNKSEQRIHSIELIVSAIEIDNCLYIMTENTNYVQHLQKVIIGLNLYNDKKQENKKSND
jgi:hypothetical protein